MLECAYARASLSCRLDERREVSGNGYGKGDLGAPGLPSLVVGQVAATAISE